MFEAELVYVCRGDGIQLTHLATICNTDAESRDRVMQQYELLRGDGCKLCARGSAEVVLGLLIVFLVLIMDTYWSISVFVP